MRFKKYIESMENDCELVKLRPDQRIHTSKQSNITLKDEQNQNTSSKPKGLWYACGDEWIKWCKGENFKLGDLKHKFVLDVDFNKILILDTTKKIDSFSKQYGANKYEISNEINNSWRWKIDSIDWQKVAEKYQGIEICPYQWDLRHEFLWYYGWDVASGCIWNKQAIKNITKI